MATGTLGSSARDYHTRQTHYLSAVINVATAPATSNSFKIGTVPAGAGILRGACVITTAFNSGSTNTVSLGVGSGGTQLVSAAAGPGTAGLTVLTLTQGTAQAPAVDTDYYVTLAFTPAAPTSGAGFVMLEYAIP